MIEDIYEMKNVYIICLRASNGEFSESEINHMDITGFKKEEVTP